MMINTQHTYFPFLNQTMRWLLIFLAALGIYANTWNNHYALDDGIVIEKNEYVLKGIAGIGKIMRTDAYESFYRQMGASDQLSGGRYRPLSLVTFAIEQEIIGPHDLLAFNSTCWDKNNNNIQDPQEDVNNDGLWNNYDCTIEGAFMRHLVNTLLYALSLVVLFQLLSKHWLKQFPDIAFLAVLLFAFHPLHTEVVANVKSRDEILSLLFIALTFWTLFEYLERKKNLLLVASLGSLLLALLAKEYAITLLVLIPATVYVFNKTTWVQALKSLLPYTAIFAVYLIIRGNVVGFKSIPQMEILNNPYLFADEGQKFATKTYVLFKYLLLQVFPHPLASDYSFKQIPYYSLTDAAFIVSLIVHIALGILTLWGLIKKHALGFWGLFYFAFLGMVSNFILDIGATMGERLAYHSSLAFCVAIAYGLYFLFTKLNIGAQLKTGLLSGVLLLIISPMAMKTIARNRDWKNDITLFTHDVNVVPNSVMVNGNAGARYIDISEWPVNKDSSQVLLQKAIFYLSKSVSLHPEYVNGHLNLGLAYFRLKQLDSASYHWNTVKRLYPNHPYLLQFMPILANEYLNQGLTAGRDNQLSVAIPLIEKARQLDSANVLINYNLGGAYFTNKEYQKAYHYWTKTLQIDSTYTDAKRGLQALQQMGIQAPSK